MPIAKAKTKQINPTKIRRDKQKRIPFDGSIERLSNNVVIILILYTTLIDIT